MLLAFIPIAIVVTITPGAATAMVVRAAAFGGPRRMLLTVIGNEVGVLAWALLSVLGISALVAASEVAFVVLKVVGAGVLIWIGVQSLRAARSGQETRMRDRKIHPGTALRDGVLTSLTNPKLAVFFVALFPQFLPKGAPVLVPTLLMAAIIVVLDLVWYSALGILVTRARRSYERSRLARRIEQLTGAVLIALGLRVALEQR